MKTDKPEKKGFFALIKEAFTKSSGCCGAGETCDGSDKDAGTDAGKDRAQAKDAQNVPVVREPGKPAQK